MTKPDAWMPFYPGDYLADTRRLSLEQHGAYLLLILDYWRNGPPPDDETTLARIIGSPVSVWRRLAPTLRPLFRVEGGELRHKRIDAEIAAATERKGKAVAKAGLAAAARWSKQQPMDASSNAPSIPQAMLEQCPSSSPASKEPKAKARKRATPLPDGFAVSERVKTWAAEKGYAKLDQHLEAFLGKCRAKGYTYLDWDEAFMNCIREDWGKVNVSKVTQMPERHGSHVPARLPEFGPKTEMPQDMKGIFAKLKLGP